MEIQRLTRSLEEFIKHEYSFMDCGAGCWKGGDDKVIAISRMKADHIQNCINMVENCQIDLNLTVNQYKEEIEKMLEDKILELREAL